MSEEITWLNPLAGEMSDDPWIPSLTRCFSVHPSGKAYDERDPRDQPIADLNSLLMVNAQEAKIEFVLPGYQPNA